MIKVYLGHYENIEKLTDIEHRHRCTLTGALGTDGYN